MDKKDKQTTRTSRDMSIQLEEDNLWDLDDDWDVGADSPDSVTQTTAEADEPKENLTEDFQKEDGPAMVEADKSENHPDTDLEETEKETPAERAPDENPQKKSAGEVTDISEKTVKGTAVADTTTKKHSLNTIEKVTLAALAAVMIGLLVWSCIWLSGRNKIANTREKVELPVVGQQATITALSTFWVTSKNSQGVNREAVVLPAITITLDEIASKNGALRLFFKNADDKSIGDPISLSFENGKFSNDSNTIEVSASDGFRQEGQFHAYQVDEAKPWRVLILEAPSADSLGTEFIELIDAPVDARRE